MTRPPKDPPAHASARQTPGRERAPDAAFNLWLQRGLHDLFDDVAKEPIPEELLRLIEEARKK
jgi:hypothetical protein